MAEDMSTMTLAQILKSGSKVTIDAGPGTGALIFCTRSGGEILRIEGDGRLVRGKDFRTDDQVSMALFDCMAATLPGFLSALRQRAENAERELADLRRQFAGQPYALTGR